MALSAKDGGGGGGGWRGRMSEKVASAFKPFLSQNLRLYRELEAVLFRELKRGGVCNSG